MNKEEAKKQAPKKVFDVMRPGKALASPTSRPVITGHKKVKEDMFVAGKEPRDKDSKYTTDNPFDEKPLMAHKDDKFSAVKAEVKEEKTEAKPAPAVEKESKVEVSVPAVTESTAPALPVNFIEEPVKPSEPEVPAEGHTEDIALVPEEDEVTPPAPEATKTEQGIDGLDLQDLMSEHPDAPAPAPEPARPVESPAPVADEPQKDSIADDAAHDVVASAGAPVLEHAVVSHHKVKSKWWEWVLIFLLIIVVALVALNFALDAEVLTLDMDVPHTNLIN
jgi:hypothetical protein